jgi:hypothetical protein
MDGWERRGVSVERRDGDGDAGAVAVVAMMSWVGRGTGREVVSMEGWRWLKLK